MEQDCIFCKIVRGGIPAHVVYEDDAFLAFLDIHPQSPGHTQVIPKAHYRWVWDLPAGRQACPNIGDYFEVAQKIAKAMQHTFGPIEEVHSRIMGEEVPHAHIWIYPAPDKAHGEKMDFEGNAEKIRQALQK